MIYGALVKIPGLEYPEEEARRKGEPRAANSVVTPSSEGSQTQTIRVGSGRTPDLFRFSLRESGVHRASRKRGGTGRLHRDDEVSGQYQEFCAPLSLEGGRAWGGLGRRRRTEILRAASVMTSTAPKIALRALVES